MSGVLPVSNLGPLIFPIFINDVHAPVRSSNLMWNHHHHHHHVPEELGVFPVPWSSRWSWSLHLFLGRPMFLLPFGSYCSARFGSLFVSILCTCCGHFFWYCFISFTMFCAPVFCLIHWFFPLSSFVTPSKFLKNFICAAYLAPRILQSDTDFVWKRCLDIGVKNGVPKTTCLHFKRQLMCQLCDTV